MVSPEFPTPPELDELRALLQSGRSSDARDASSGPPCVPTVAWGPLFHFAATRGSWDDPVPLLWVDALRELDELEIGDRDDRSAGGRSVEGRGTLPSSSSTEVLGCLSCLAELPVLSLETKWLRQTPREDIAFVYTGSLADVIEAGSLEDAALRLSRLLRTVDSYDYSRELIRDAAAWDVTDPTGTGLRLGFAVSRRAGWNDDDPAERERARAVLLRWLGYLRRRNPAIPARPPRGQEEPWPVVPTLEAWAESGEPVSRDAVSFLATVGRVQGDTRVMGASLAAALRGRWRRWTGGATDATASSTPSRTDVRKDVSAVGVRGGGTAEATGVDACAERVSELLWSLDLAWIERAVSPEVSRALGTRS